MRLSLSLFLTVSLCGPVGVSHAGDLPLFRGGESVERSVALDNVARVRFVTTTDFPPFSFLDKEGRLTGFNIDLARSLCETIELLDRCELQALPWTELVTAIERRQAEVIIGGLSVSAERRRTMDFTHSYLRLPARFATRKADEAGIEDIVSGKVQTGVIDGSAHAAMLSAYFPGARPTKYTQAEWMFRDLKSGKIGAIFGDGMNLSFWIRGSESESCCLLAGGAYPGNGFLGHGFSLAVTKDIPNLSEALDRALLQLEESGRVAELYKRYFPVGFF